MKNKKAENKKGNSKINLGPLVSMLENTTLFCMILVVLFTILTFYEIHIQHMFFFHKLLGIVAYGGTLFGGILSSIFRHWDESERKEIENFDL